MLAALSMVAMPTRSWSHAISVDGGTTDWTLAAPAIENLGHIGRGAGSVGEFVWTDAGIDERTDLGTDGSADFTEVRVTATSTEISFLVRMREITLTQTSGAGAPQVQIAIDLDRVPGSGQSYLAGFADTQVDPQAAWEFLLQTTFGSGSSTARTLDPAFNPIGSDPAVIDAASNAIEFSIPWSRFGLFGPPATPLRFTVASFLAGPTDDTQQIGGAETSNAIDCVTNYGDPRTSLFPNTFADVGDQVINYAFDVYFSSDGNPMAPLLVSEALYDPAGAEPGGEWIELFNPTTQALSLNDFKLGDEETPDGPEGMGRFPVGPTLAAGGALVVAVNATTFQTAYGFPPDFETASSDGAVPDLVVYSPWSPSSSFVLQNTGEEVLVLDRWDTVLDVLTYGTSVWPGVTAHAVVPEANSLDRSPPTLDTNDCNTDFIARSTPGPGALPRDLEATTLVAPSLGKTGCASIAVSIAVTCVAGPTTPCRAGIYLSGDATVTTSDVLIAAVNLPAMTTGLAYPQNLTVSLPASASGELALGLIVDDLGQLSESDETNNTRTQAFSHPVPWILDVADIPNDQGRHARIHFSASTRDVEASATPIVQYEAYRRIDLALLEEQPNVRTSTIRAAEPAGAISVPALLLAGWEFAGAVPAHGESEYNMVAPTLEDSIGVGMGRSVFFVRAATATPTLFFDSCPDSGYSVDNVAPISPSSFTAQYFTGDPPLIALRALSPGYTWFHWGANAEPDFLEYRLHRGNAADFVSGPENLVVAKPDTGYIDVGHAGGYYKLLAVDAHGNASGAALLTPNDIVGISTSPLPSTLWLAPVAPNPIRESALFRIGLPRPGHISLRIHDAAGRQVRQLVSSWLPAGQHTVGWDTRDSRGGRVPNGLYFVRLEADRQVKARSMVAAR
jgi:lamin tail-like protein/flagellar hook capping protein FlgD